MFAVACDVEECDEEEEGWDRNNSKLFHFKPRRKKTSGLFEPSRVATRVTWHDAPPAVPGV